MRRQYTAQRILGVIVQGFGILTFVLVEWLRRITPPLVITASRSTPGTLLGVVAGVRGWESIEFQEISRSAREYVGEGRVLNLVVSSSKTYLRQVWRALVDSGVTHYFFDPRTGSQSFLGSTFQTFVIGVMLTWRGVTPIGYCTDISERQWRLQVAFVTATRGVCVSFMDASAVGRIFPHRRVIGPSIMPFSVETFERVSKLRSGGLSLMKNPVSFVGSLYEPRTSKLFRIKEALERDGISFDISSRKVGESRGPIDLYWESLSASEIQVTTTSQVRERGRDMSEANQLVYRATEALVCGAALVMEEVVGASKFFEDGVDFYSFRDPSEAASVIRRLLVDRSELEVVQRAGNQKIERIIRDQVFWRTIDKALGSKSLQSGIPEERN